MTVIIADNLLKGSECPNNCSKWLGVGAAVLGVHTSK